MSTGSKLVNNIELKDGITVGANAVLRQSIESNDVLVVGVPARIKETSSKWWIRDGKKYTERVQMVEELKRKMNI